ncbi:MAG: hypothetical protein ACLQMF_19280 [Rectinemataceae bacterium]
MSVATNDSGRTRGVMIKESPVAVATEERTLFTEGEGIAMRKGISGKLVSTKNWLGKAAQADLNIKPAQAALANAEKATLELEALKAKVAETAKAKKAAMRTLDAAIEKVETEKKLKAKEAKVQAKLAVLVATA